MKKTLLILGIALTSLNAYSQQRTFNNSYLETIKKGSKLGDYKPKKDTLTGCVVVKKTKKIVINKANSFKTLNSKDVDFNLKIDEGRKLIKKGRKQFIYGLIISSLSTVILNKSYIKGSISNSQYIAGVSVGLTVGASLKVSGAINYIKGINKLIKKL